MTKKAFLIASLLGLGVFLIYVHKLSPTVYTGDSGDLILAAAKLGVPHPPGYPLHTLIGHLFTLLPFGTSPAWKVNLMSAFFEAATVTIVFLIIYLLTKRLIIAFFGASLLAFSFIFWFYGEFAEVFPLNNFLLSLSLLFAVLFSQKQRIVFLYLLAFFFGLSLSHHQTGILFLPAIIAILWPRKKIIFQPRVIFFSLVFFLIPFLFYLYPLFAHFGQPPIIWDEPRNFFDLVRLFTRADYGTFQSTRNALESAQDRILPMILYQRLFIVDFTYLGAVLLILGFISLLLSSRIVAFGILLSFLFSGLLFLAYANFPLTGTFEILVIERFVLLSFILAVIVMSLGLLLLSQWGSVGIAKVFRSKKVQSFLMAAIPAIFLIFPAVLFISNFQKIDLSKNYLGKNFIEDFFSSVDKDSIVFLRSDFVVFNSWYFHFVEGMRPDLKLLTSHLVLDWFYTKTLPRNYPKLSYPENVSGVERFKSFVKANIQTHPVYYYVSPVEIEGFVWVPEGLLYKLYPKESVPNIEEVKKGNDDIWQRYRIPPYNVYGYKDLLYDFSVELYSDGQAALGNYFFSQKAHKEAKGAYLRALEINPASQPPRTNLASVYLVLGECQKALDEFFQVLSQDKHNKQAEAGVVLTYRDCLHDEDKAKSFQEKRGQVKEKYPRSIPLEEF